MNIPISFANLHKAKLKITQSIQHLVQSSVVRNFFIYSFGSFLLRGISIFIAPITMSILTPADYGLLSLANSFISILAVFLGLGLRQAFSLEYFHCHGEQKKRLLNHIILIYICAAIPLFFLLISNESVINKLFFLQQAPPYLLTISLCISFSFFFVELFYQVLLYQCKAFQRTALQIGIALITIACNLLFLCIFKWGVISLLCGQLIGMVLVLLIGGYHYIKKSCHHNLFFNKTLSTTLYYLKNGLPFVPGVLLSWIISSGDKWVLGYLTDLHNVGIYSVANSFGQLFQLLILYPMSGSYLPYLLKTFATSKDRIKALEQVNKKRMVHCMIGLFFMITFAYFITKSFLLWLVPSAYHPALSFVWFILMGQLFVLGTYFANCLIQYYKKTYFLAFSLAIPAGCNLVLNYLLIPLYGIYGCVFATLTSYLLYFLVSLFYNLNLVKKIPREISRD